MQLTKVIAEGKTGKWVGVASDEDIIGSLVVCLCLSGLEDRIGMVVGPTTSLFLHHVGATATIQKDGHPVREILVPDET